MPKSLVKHHVIAFDLDGPHNNAMEEVPNHDLLSKHLRNHFDKAGMSPIEVIKVLILTPHISCMMKVAHHQALCAWMQSQNLRSTDLLLLGRQKMHWLEMGVGGDAGPPFVDHNSFVPKGPHKNNFLAGVDRVPNVVLVKLVIPHKIPLPFSTALVMLGAPLITKSLPN